MAFVHYPTGCLQPYHGLPELFGFHNHDGEKTRTNCGQAAAATLLTFLKPIPTTRAAELMAFLECRHPPDNLGGVFGTSRRCVERIMRAYGCRPRAIHGEEELRRCLDRKIPVALMLQVEAGMFWKWNLPGGHWVVAFGYDREHVYCTNWGAQIHWPEFRRRWQGWLCRLISMRQTGIVAETQSTMTQII